MQLVLELSQSLEGKVGKGTGKAKINLMSSWDELGGAMRPGLREEGI